MDSEHGVELSWSALHLSHPSSVVANDGAETLYILAMLDEGKVLHHAPVEYSEDNFISGKLRVLIPSGIHSLLLALSLSPQISDFVGVSSLVLNMSLGSFDYDQLLETQTEFEPFQYDDFGNVSQTTEDQDSDSADDDAPPGLYTTHTCVGGDTHQTENVSDGMCLFKNLCMIRGAFTYFLHPGLRDPIIPRLHATGRRHSWEPREVFLPTITRGPGPPDIPLDPRLHVYVRRFHQYNYGHVLGDDCWPIFQGMAQFDLADYDNQIIIDDDFDDLQSSSYPSNKMFLSVSRNPVLGRKRYRDAAVCFAAFITGFGRYGYGSGRGAELEVRDPAWGKGALFRRWRAFVWRELAVPPPPPLRPPAFRLTLIDKDALRASHRFRIANGPELLAGLRRAFPRARARAVCWARMSMRDTLAAVRASDVAVALPGSDVMRGVFLPDGALVILPCRRGPPTIAFEGGADGWQPRSPEAILWLRHLPYVEVAEYCGHRCAPAVAPAA
jgi:hypothetical protein